jgi:hypothetical protein
LQPVNHYRSALPEVAGERRLCDRPIATAQFWIRGFSTATPYDGSSDEPKESTMTASRSRVRANSSAERARQLEAAEHSIQMEGGYISSAARADGDKYIAGSITASELVARTRRRHGLD